MTTEPEKINGQNLEKGSPGAATDGQPAETPNSESVDVMAGESASASPVEADTADATSVGTNPEDPSGEGVADVVEDVSREEKQKDESASPAAFDDLELDPEEDSEVSPAAAKVEALNREVQDLRSKLEDTTGQYLRITADFENFRKRTRKEQGEQEVKVKCSTLLELLPVIDNFERARTQLKPEGDAAINIHKSYQGIYKQLVDCLKRIGVSPMRAEGSEFDPMLHEAVMREPTNEHPDGTVLEELQRGYMLGERVLRHAMVRVAVTPDPTVENSSEET